MLKIYKFRIINQKANRLTLSILLIIKYLRNQKSCQGKSQSVLIPTESTTPRECVIIATTEEARPKWLMLASIQIDHIIQTDFAKTVT